MKLIEKNPTLTVDSKTTVVSHDNQPALPVLKSDMTYSEATEHINALYKMRLQWERDQYRTSCTQLYELLRECFRVAIHEDIDNLDSSLRRCIEDQCKRKMLKILKSTTIEAKIVRSVFESLNNRQRVSAYAIVIQAAKLEYVNVDHFVEWLELKGGVEEVRLSNTNNTQRAKKHFKVTNYKPPSAYEIRRGKENFDAFLSRMNETEDSTESADIDQSIALSDDSSTGSDRSNDIPSSTHKHLDICTDEKCFCNAVVANDKEFTCESIDSSSSLETTESVASDAKMFSVTDNDLIVCIAKQHRDKESTEIVYAVTDDALSRLVFARYAEARYGKSEQLSELTRNIVSEIAA
jgi:hypothetical protein